MKNKITRIFAVLLIILTAIIAFPAMDADLNVFSINASAATASGKFNNSSISWSYDNSTKTLTVSGTGDMPNYTATPGVFTSTNSTVGVVIKNDAQKIVINSGITHIGQFAFKEFTNVTSVSFSSTVKTIGKNSFYGCTKLASVTIPSSVTTLGNSVFEGCTSLTDITLNEGLTQISSYCFKSTKISTFTAPSTLKIIRPNAFALCSLLSYVNLNGGLTELDSNAFHNCPALKTVVFSKGITSINADVFSGTTKPENLTIPSTFKLGTIYKGNTTIKNVTFSEGVTSVGASAFQNCTGLVSVTIPSTVTSLGKSAFEGCTSLSTVNLSEGLKTIGAYCFKKTQFKDVDLPYSVTKVDAHAFAMVSNLRISCNYGDAAYEYCNSGYLNSSYSQTYVLRTPELKIDSYIVEGGTKLKVALKIKNASGFNAANLDFTYTEGIVPVSTEPVSIENSNVIGTVAYNSPGNVSIALMSADCVPYSACIGECEYTIGELIFDILGTKDTSTLTFSSRVFMLADQRFTVETAVDTADLFIDGVHAHMYGSGMVTKSATCIETGIKVYTCSVCGEEKTEDIPIDSSYHAGETEIRNDVAANCISEGYTGDLHCADCDAVIETGTTTPATGIHVYDDGVVTTPADCKTEGVKTYTCTGCSDSYTETIPVSDIHSYDDGVVTTTPTCVSEGVKTYTCTVCDMTIPATMKKDADNHVGETEIKNYSAATCDTAGYTGDKYCTSCEGLIENGSVTEALGHSYDGGTYTTVPTCNATGVKTYTCLVCGDSYEEDISIDADNHVGGTEIRNTDSATCGAPGYTGDKYCKGCDAVLETGETVPATGNHDYTGVVTTTPGCTTPGIRTFTCSVCGSTETEDIDPVGHSYSSTVVEPTNTSGGYTIHTCSNCGDTYKDNYTDPLVIAYFVKYDANGGKGIMADSSHIFGTGSALSTNTYTRTGYIFLGWSKTNTDVTASYTDGHIVSDLTEENDSTVVLYAVWKPITYSVAYNANGGKGTMANSNHTFGTGSALSTNTYTRTGYIFLGWSKTKTATTANYADGYVATGLTGVQGKTVTLYAVWKPINYFVRYNANGGKGIMLDSSHTFGTGSALTANTYTRTGYLFLGWSKTKTATTASYADGYVANGLTGVDGRVVNLYAVWKPITYSVAYNANGGKGTMADSSHTFGTGSALTANTYTRTGYIFLGWSRTKTATTASYTDEHIVSGLTGVQDKTVTLYAVWKPNTYFVAYNANGGKGTMENSTHTFGVAQALSTNTYTRTGYTFLGWAKSKSATTPNYVDCKEVSGLTGVDGRVVNLYAVWKANTYYVKYNANGGKGTMENSTHTFGVAQALSTNTFTRTGYIFLGWAKSKSATTPNYVDCKEVSGLTGVDGRVVNLYAVWKPINYSVRYNANGGIGSMTDSSHTFGTGKALTANTFTREGYTFLGWSKTKSATTASYSDKQVVSGLTGVDGRVVNLYAVWKKN